jgi:Protein of unknown function (DUF3365)
MWSHDKSILFLILLAVALSGCTKMNKNTGAELKEPIPDSVYVKEGNKIVTLTFDTLRNSLIHAMETQSVEGAIEFCNEKAFALTSSYSNDVSVRRTALRFRNPSNKPDSLESMVLREYDGEMKSGNGAQVRIIRKSSSEEIHFFKPIILQPMCLNCHGTPGKDIKPATLAGIKEFYPDDLAINYRPGDLRGVWHIIFKTQKN